MTPLRSAKEYALRVALGQSVALLSRAQQHHLIRLMRGAERLAPGEVHKREIAWVRELFQHDHPATQLALRVLHETHPRVRKRFFEGLFLNNWFLGHRLRHHVCEQHGFMPPALMVISPTMRCNLRCYGCYAWRYSKQEELAPEVFERLLNEAKQMGIHFLTISGGEPFMYEPLLPLAEQHPDMVFQIYTNGTFIDRPLAARLAELGNVYPAISVEGLREETDGRRGPGTFDRVVEAMRALRGEGCLWGFSNTATRLNTDLITRPEFIDFWVEQGCYFGWFFTYIPIGREPNLELMQTPEQRDRLRVWTLEIRRTRPIFVGDFWNDGHLTQGCMAGGRMYLHINHRGDVEPCVFCHFAVDNIHRSSLAEALNSEFFRHIREQIPYHDNVLRPCMIIDHPAVLREAVERFGAVSTDNGGQSLLCEIAPDLDRYAAQWGELADRAWADGYEWAKAGGLLASSSSDSTGRQG